MTDLQDLNARVEAGEGADRGLDAEVAVAMRTGLPTGCDWAHNFPKWERDPVPNGVVRVIGNINGNGDYIAGHFRSPTYTASIDAVMTLMPTECFWQLGHDGGGPDPSRFRARVFDPMVMRGPCISVSGDPVRALLAAILRDKAGGA